MTDNGKVLVTGVSGFLGSHTTIQLLNKGYAVVGTLRDRNRAHEIEQVIAKHTSNVDQLSFAEADLMDGDVWLELMAGVDYVLHIASPFPRELPKREDEVVAPARIGTINVLKAASAAGVRRVVVTSSSTAIAYGREKGERSGTYDENDWTDIANEEDTTPYFRSKTIAEKAAWDFVAQDTSGLELSTICPGAMLGPVLEKDLGTSANMVVKIMDGSTPAIPRIGFDVVDVRSVAELHIRAMEMKEASGERFIGSAGYLTWKEMADILRQTYPGRKIPRATLPDFATRLISNFEPTLKPLLVELGAERRLDNSKAKRLLGWQPLSPEEAVRSLAESLINLQIV
jgi:dihydroflavonol-4-reductase